MRVRKIVLALFTHNDGKKKCVGLYIAIAVSENITYIYIRKYIESFLDKAREQCVRDF